MKYENWDAMVKAAKGNNYQSPLPEIRNSRSMLTDHYSKIRASQSTESQLKDKFSYQTEESRQEEITRLEQLINQKQIGLPQLITNSSKLLPKYAELDSSPEKVMHANIKESPNVATSSNERNLQLTQEVLKWRTKCEILEQKLISLGHGDSLTSSTAFNSINNTDLELTQVKMQLQNKTQELRETIQKMKYFQDEFNKVKLELMRERQIQPKQSILQQASQKEPKTQTQLKLEEHEQKLKDEQIKQLKIENQNLKTEIAILTDRASRIQQLWRNVDSEIASYQAQVEQLKKDNSKLTSNMKLLQDHYKGR